MHTRPVIYRGFERDDGLWDIEGELLDTKPHALMIEGEGEWTPYEPIHHMSLRVTLDGTMVIRDIAVAMHAHPHDPCPQAMPPMCRSIKTLFNFEPPASELEIRDASLRFMREISECNVL